MIRCIKKILGEVKDDNSKLCSYHIVTLLLWTSRYSTLTSSNHKPATSPNPMLHDGKNEFLIVKRFIYRNLFWPAAEVEMQELLH